MSLFNLKTTGLSWSPDLVTVGIRDLAGVLGSGIGDLATLPVRLAPPALPAGNAPFSTIYAFGDSLSDAGNLYTVTLHAIPAAPYVDGHFTNGAVWVQDLAAGLGLPVPQPSTLGGTDFAYGDAETGSEALHALSPIDLPSQLLQFTAAHPLPDPNALYTLSIGGNDVFDAIAAYPANPTVAMADITGAVGNEMRFISALAGDGARNLAVLNVPDLGLTPSETAQGAQTGQLASSLSALYDAQLGASLSSLAASDHLNLHLVNSYALLDQAVSNPAAFGFSNVTEPVWTGNYTDPGSGTLNATGAAQNGYLFFDGVHPTAAAHALLAAAAQSSLGSAA